MLIEFKAHDHKGTQEACMPAIKNPQRYSTDGRDFIGFLSQYTQLFCFSLIERKKINVICPERKVKFFNLLRRVAATIMMLQ